MAMTAFAWTSFILKSFMRAEIAASAFSAVRIVSITFSISFSARRMPATIFILLRASVRSNFTLLAVTCTACLM